jgi:hypothetical protein
VAPAMKKQYINTLIALVILAGLWAGFTYYDKRKNPSVPAGTTVETRTVEKLFPVDSKHIQSFSLKPKDTAPITCRLESGKWMIEAPQKLAADQSTISSFLESLTSANVDEVVDAHPANLKDFGLDPPNETVEVGTDTKPAQFALMLGDETPTSSGVYVQVGGNPRVVTLPSSQKTSLTKTLFDLRDKRAVTLDADQIQKIEVKSKDKSYTLEKNPEGVWDLVLPPPVRAERFSVDGLVSQLRGLAMTSVVAEDKKKSAQYGFGSPTISVKLASPAGSQELVLGKKDGEKYDAINSALDPVFTLNADFLTQFQKDPSDLRAKDLFSVQTFDVTHLDVETPKGHWTFQKQKDKWKETAPASKDLASDKVESLLYSVHDLRADSFPKEHAADLSAFDLAKPAYRFEMQAGDKKEIVEAAKVGDHVYARRSTDPLPSELSKTALDPIDKALTGL